MLFLKVADEPSRRAQKEIQAPAKWRWRIVGLIDQEQWSSLSADVKGDA